MIATNVDKKDIQYKVEVYIEVIRYYINIKVNNFFNIIDDIKYIHMIFKYIYEIHF